MVKQEMLQKAIAAHASWKARLRAAVNSGTFEIAPETVSADNQCEFGKWLYGTELSREEKQSEQYRSVRQLHAEFHQEAGKVVGMATSGKQKEAETAIDLGGSYAKASTALTEAVIKWRDSP